jgi:hypothetical protein
MATRSLSNGPGALRNPSSGALGEEDYRTFCTALESTQRGRDFLAEYGRRNRNADTEMLLNSLDRIESMMKAEGAARDRLQDELRVLLIAIRLARPDINSATALTQAARLVDLLDMMERRIDAMVENKELLPIEEEPLPPAPAALSVVPRPDEPELPIPSAAGMQPPPMALVQDVAIQELPKQELPARELPKKQELPKQELPQHRLPQPEPLETPRLEAAKPQEPPEETAIQEIAKQALAKQEALIEARRGVPADPYPLFAEEDAAPAKSPEEKWLPDFGAEAQIIHTQPVRAMAFMPEVAFVNAPVAKVEAATASLPSPLVGEGGSRAALAKREPGEGSVRNESADSSPASLTSFARHPLPQGEREKEMASAPALVESSLIAAVVETEIAAPPAPKPEIARLRDHPLAAIMSLSEEERIALFT